MIWPGGQIVGVAVGAVVGVGLAVGDIVAAGVEEGSGVGDVVAVVMAVTAVVAVSRDAGVSAARACVGKGWEG